MILSFNPPNLSRIQQRALIVGIVGMVLLLIGAFLKRDQFFQAYLVGFTFWTGIAVGSLALLMLQHLTGGGWGLVIRRVLEGVYQNITSDHRSLHSHHHRCALALSMDA